MRIGIALPTLVNGDAVGHDVFGMARVIRKLGHDVEFFAWTNASEESVRMLDEMPRVLRSPDDVLIYHHAIGCEPGVKALERLPCRRKVVKYHNVTPPEFFAKTNPKIAEGCAEGLRQLPRLARAATAIWADSAFNARDFETLAPAGPVVELPPFHQADELFHAEEREYLARGPGRSEQECAAGGAGVCRVPSQISATCPADCRGELAVA
mgnify:CR=1 FL=1